uniref:Ig-like domain-containing protein n=1 Tax=Haplochromis burtoni TaxID=8153 RepID=A0A3Q2WKC0_HAPBU
MEDPPHSCLSVCVHVLLSALLPEVVEVLQGEKSVLLPFKTTADLPQHVTVEWTDSNAMKVHVYESGNNQPDKQHQSYRGRTEMKEDPLRNKDLSLTLKPLHLTDSGVYTCIVYKKDGHMLQKSVTLSVSGECNSCLSTV